MTSRLAKYRNRTLLGSGGDKSTAPVGNDRDFQDNSHIWKPESEKEIRSRNKKIATYTVRLLPNNINQETLFNTIYKHHYYNKSNTKESITYDCLKNYGEVSCPICDLQAEAKRVHEARGGSKNNMPIFTSGMSCKKEVYANAIIVKDEFRPENEGKMFLIEMKAYFLEVLNNHINKDKLAELHDLDKFCDALDQEKGAELLIVVDLDADMFKRYNSSKLININTPLCDGDQAKIDATLDSIKDLSNATPKYFDSYIREAKTADALLNLYIKALPSQKWGDDVRTPALNKKLAQGSEVDEGTSEMSTNKENFESRSNNQRPAEPAQETQQPAQQSAQTFDDYDDDIPF